jgi:zinc transporter 5/7
MPTVVGSVKAPEGTVEAGSKKKEKKQFRNENVAGLFFHIMSDALGSVAVIVSAVCIRHYNLLIADPICSLAISALIVFSIVSLLRSTIRTLTLRVSADVSRELQTLTSQVLAIPSVTECVNMRLWQFRRNELVLTGKVELDAGGDIHAVQAQLQGVSNTYSIIHRMLELAPGFTLTATED